MKYKILTLLLLIPALLPAQDRKVAARRTYTIAVQELSGEEQIEFTSRLKSEVAHRGSRGFAEDVFNLYRKSAGDIFSDAAGRAMNVAVNYAVENVRSKRGKWENAVNKECRFSKNLKMVSEIHHFYNELSTIGPMDPTGIVFDGFTCSQDIKVGDETQNVFSVVCKVRTDSLGIRSITSDSRFLLYVDEVAFNPYLCDIPNDSLDNVDFRIPFDFQKRKDLKLKIRATISSSWMNQVLQITRDQVLGTFDIEIGIDPEYIETDGTGASVFRYKYAPGNKANRLVKVTGDSFIVPRSYVASNVDGDTWGMGQYKVDLVISESCSINRDYYLKKGSKTEWDENAWKPEWEKIRQRPKRTGFWKDMWDAVSQGWSNGQWVVKATSPMTSYLVKQGSTFINGGSSSSGGAAAQAASPASGSTGTKPSGSGGKPSGGEGKPSGGVPPQGAGGH